MRTLAAARLIVHLIFFYSLLAPGCAQTVAKRRVATEADLPQFSYPVNVGVQQLLEMPASEFAKFALPIRSDIEKTLDGYEIEDHAAHRNLLQARLNLEILLGEDPAALETIRHVRALEDKPAAKLTSALTEEAIARSRLAGAVNNNSGCPAGYRAAYEKSVQALPWAAVGQSIKRSASFAGLMSKPFFAGVADSNLGPMVTKEHALTLSGAETLLESRVEIEFAVACKQQTLDVLNAYVKLHEVPKTNIWGAREAVLPPLEKLTPVNVGIWDSGFDTALFPGRLFVDTAAVVEDRHGIAFDVFCHRTHGELIPLTSKELKDYPDFVAVMQAIGDIQSGVDTPAAIAFKQKTSAMSPQQMRSLLDEAQIIGGYAHGTHVAGIAARGNPAIRLAYVRLTYDNGNPHRPPTDELLKDLSDSYAASLQWFRDHHIRVVNMSWTDTPASFEKDLTDNGIGKDDAERKQLARHYFQIESSGLYAALKSAPEILFVTVAGNDNEDNAFLEVIPSSYRLPNLIVAGAVDQAGDETDFTGYGDNVAVDADGQAVVSVVPGGAAVSMSGTSMAAPQVTNLAGKLLAINPALTPPQVIALIRDGSDASDDGRRHLLNPRRSVELLQKGMTPVK